MKKIISLTIFALFVSSIALFAIPARPGKTVYTQPDGTTVTLVTHGDEWFHWVTDESGNIMEMNEDGYYVVSPSSSADYVRRGVDLARENRNLMNARRLAKASPALNHGSPKIPVFLIGFKDKSFSKTNAQFSNMLNLEDYSVNGAIGSVKDFYKENSLGTFTPVFEVLGPVKLDNNMSYYGGNSGGSDIRPYQALIDAAKKLDGSVDFSDFDNDGDGTVDFILFYFAGYDEAQGGGSNCIWSHSWELSALDSYYEYKTNYRTFDEVKLDKYFCTSELIGNSGSTICNIGTTCHEFGHALGLPDFYDTDYDTNSTPNDMYEYSTMCSGSYNNDSRTPPYFTSEELKILGWYDDQEYITSNGPITLYPVNVPGATSYHGYRTDTDNPGEYFVYDVCSGQRWCAGLPQGMIVYHVDKSNNVITSGVKAVDTWGDSNNLNAWGVHPCCYLIPAVDQDNLQFGLVHYGYPYNQWVFEGDLEDFPFPNTNTTPAVTSYSPVAWDGNTFGYDFTNIEYHSSNYTVTMNVFNANNPSPVETYYNYIEDPSNGVYSPGYVFALNLVETTGDRKPGTAVSWFYDGEPVSGQSVTLTAGEHVIEARFTTTGGKEKVVELDLNVQ